MSAERRGWPGVLSAVVAIATLPVGLLTGLFVGIEAAVAVFVVGWLLLVPVIPVVGRALLPAVSGDEEAGDGATEVADDPLSALKERYVRGELGDEEFEREVDRLLSGDDEPASVAGRPAPERAVEDEAG